jgi:2-oxoglutarate dehydrogenase E1 component
MQDTERWPNDLSLPFVEDLYSDYLRNPDSVPLDWRRYFEGLSDGRDGQAAARVGPSFSPTSIFSPAGKGCPHCPNLRQDAELASLQHRVDQLIRNYRVRGHIVARVDPLGQPRPEPPELRPDLYGFSEDLLDRPFAGKQFNGQTLVTVRQIIEHMRNTYCRSIGAQFMHIDDLAVRNWLQERMESTENRLELSREEQIRILTRLTDAVIFEEFIQRKYIGAKTFSLEGGESLIPLLDLAIEKAGTQGIDEIVLGMAHRGRLNVLANILHKSPQVIFREFEDVEHNINWGRGDVKYHQGYSGDWFTAEGRKIHLSLTFNPSHLEFVNPVAMGRVRAKQDRTGDTNRNRVMTLLIHGDAAFAGEGIVQESLNLSELDGYTVGGALHVIVNNQLGFTTPPHQGRSSIYASDVAKMLQSPIFHVNGEDPEAVTQVVRLAMDFRSTFERDVFIDMYCYRRRGHNEGDEPHYTQPLLYQTIENRKSVREGYLEHLLELGEVTREEADQIARERTERLEKELSAARHGRNLLESHTLGGVWHGYLGGPATNAEEIATGVEKDRLCQLLQVQTRLPEDFHPHRKIEKLLEARGEMAAGKRPLDWATAEAAALASLAAEGIRLRLAGQDTERGTFSHRHTVLHDIQDGHTYTPLQHVAPDQAIVEIHNSPLSEAGVLGFEYGYSLESPGWLVVWEAQFGDFSNAAQVIIDQFIASAEDKWRRLSGLVLLLPHGFEGQGPEHSSARLERFLALAAEDNIQVVYPSTPAQYFHLLRRQALRRWRKPLVVMTPKSLLRHPQAVSNLEDLAEGRFADVLPDEYPRRPESIDRVLLCSGKIYYELAQRRRDLNREDVAVLRLEQIYPTPMAALRAALAGFKDNTPVYWVQEEPENMGAWRYLLVQFGRRLFSRLPFAGITRPTAASPATGSSSRHKLEQEALLTEAFGGGTIAG